MVQLDVRLCDGADVMARTILPPPPDMLPALPIPEDERADEARWESLIAEARETWRPPPRLEVEEV